MKILPLQNLAARHSGVTPSIAGCYEEAASVCLARHHAPPTELEVSANDTTSVCEVRWTFPDIRIIAAHANDIDATELAAYGVALATIEMERQLFAISRAETRTGADYYVAPTGQDVSDLENCIRLEVSGTDRGSQSTLQHRLSDKITQVAKGASNLPAIALVVGFEIRKVLISTLVEHS